MEKILQKQELTPGCSKPKGTINLYYEFYNCQNEIQSSSILVFSDYFWNGELFPIISEMGSFSSEACTTRIQHDSTEALVNDTVY